MKERLLMFFLCAAAGGLAGCAKPVEIVAHRGSSYLAPENTLSAVKLAWRQQVDVEVDVHLTRDNRIVVIHDASTKHITGVDMKVSETNFDELSKLDYGRFKGEQFTGEPLPLLSEVLKTVPWGRRLFIEIKCGPEILPFLREVIEDSGKKSQVVVIGFSLDTVAAGKEILDVPTYWLRSTRKTQDTDEWIEHDEALVRFAAERGLDGLDVHYAGVTQRFVQAVEAAGQKLYVWTVDDPAEAQRLVGLGVSGITTNRPQWLRKQLKQ